MKGPVKMCYHELTVSLVVVLIGDSGTAKLAVTDLSSLVPLKHNLRTGIHYLSVMKNRSPCPIIDPFPYCVARCPYSAAIKGSRFNLLHRYSFIRLGFGKDSGR